MSVTATLGMVAGVNNFTASSGVLPTLTFSATGVAGAAAALVKVSGDLQSATVGTALPTPFVVRVEDSYGYPVSGSSVTFTEATGGGSVSPASVTSAANGEASATAMLGAVAGINSFTVSSGLLPTLTFSATGLAAAAALLEIVSGEGARRARTLRR